MPIWAGHARFWLSAMAPSSRLLEDFEAQRGYDEHVEEPLETNKVRFFGMMGSSVACTQASRIVAAHDSTSPEKIKGPDNPTSQLLPIKSKTCCSGDGERRKDKGGGGGKMVCDKVVCVKDGVVKDGV